jgi:hypothetical protein
VLLAYPVLRGPENWKGFAVFLCRLVTGFFGA